MGRSLVDGQPLTGFASFAGAVLDAASVMLLVLEGPDRLLWANHAFEARSGWALANLPKPRWLETLVTRGDRGRMAELIRQAFDEGREARWPGSFVTKDGREVRVEWRVSRASQGDHHVVVLVSVEPIDTVESDGDLTSGQLFGQIVDNAPLVRHRAVGVAEDISVTCEHESALRAVLEEKTILIREIHHRVKNNLQIISSLLYLHSQTATDSAQRAIAEIGLRVAAMALIHETLYESQDLARVDFARYVRRLAAVLLESHGIGSRVRVSVDADGVALDVSKALPCGLVVAELVSSALEHAFSGGRCGVINVRLQVEGTERIRLSVTDDGICPSPSVDVAATLGRRLIDALVAQLDGTLTVRTGDGTTAVLSFPNGAPVLRLGKARRRA